MALALDGSATAFGATVTLSTSLTNDVICCFIKYVSGQPTSITDTAGLTWIRRYTSGTQGVNACLDLWYAISPGILTADVITPVGATGTPRYLVFGVNGANTTTPFDVNVSLPAASVGIAGNTNTKTISTTNANTMLLACIDTGNTFPTFTEPTGFTQIINAAGSMDASYQIVSSVQSSVAITYSWVNSGIAACMLVDAIQAAGGTPATPTGQQMIGMNSFGFNPLGFQQ